jgi:predicted aspartyl protease
MSRIEGPIDTSGAVISVRIEVSPRQAFALRQRGRPVPIGVDILAVVDTGASCSVLDEQIIRRLSLAPLGRVSIHTPSTGQAYVQRGSYLASIILGAGEPGRIEFVSRVIESELASQGFLALIGRDVLSRCILTFDGPADRFVLEY